MHGWPYPEAGMGVTGPSIASSGEPEACLGLVFPDGPTLRRVLGRTSMGMQPEGIAGVFHGARPAREAVFLRKRHGFIRLAIQAGTGMLNPWLTHHASRLR